MLFRSGAIHRAGGRAILDACKEIRRVQYPEGLPTGEAVITTGGSLIAKYVIHTVLRPGRTNLPARNMCEIERQRGNERAPVLGAIKKLAGV